MHDVVARTRDALSRAPAGLITDLDGTLAPIAPLPEAAALAPGAREVLSTLLDRLAVVAIVTGRSAVDARRITEDDRLLVVGNHGIEWLSPGAAVPRSELALAGVAPRIEAAFDALRAELRDLPGIVYEHKGLSGTVHYRLAPDPDAAHELIAQAIAATRVRHNVDVREGQMAIELRPPGAGDKGTALRGIVERHRLRGVVVLGDDRTDVDMFRAATELRDAGRVSAFIGAVGPDGAVPDDVREAADAVIATPTQVVELLRAVARRPT